jgi:hypothetical protein
MGILKYSSSLRYSSFFAYIVDRRNLHIFGSLEGPKQGLSTALIEALS